MHTSFGTRALPALYLLLVLIQAAPACINDRDSDSLARQAQGLPDTIAVITGRFPRNLPLFYQMRIQRVGREIRTNPSQLRLYDDIAAACDHLGRDDEAIQWMDQKRTRLGKTSPANPSFHEDWYRYYANVGTFRAHRWIRAGAKQDHAKELSQARDEIARAIQIKPDAHFGRERYQLAVMDWLLHHRKETLASYLPQSKAVLDTEMADLSHEKIIVQASEGLSGLIVLGGAWESPDIFAALAGTLSQWGKGDVGNLADQRSHELLAAGRHSLRIADNSGVTQPSSYSLSDYHKDLHTKYQALRAEAEEWQSRRGKYMMPLLRAGRHPDTDPSFWKDWKDTQPPSLYVAKRWTLSRIAYGGYLAIVYVAFASIVIAPLILLAVAVRRAYLWMRQ